MAVTKRPLFDAPIVRARRSRDVVHASSRRATWCGTRSCSWCWSAACSPRSCSCATSRPGSGEIGFTLQIALWLWFTVLFANFAEAMAEGRGKAQADSLRATRTQTMAKQLDESANKTAIVAASSAQRCASGDFVICMPGDVIPGRRRGDRRRRLGRRVGHHRRIGAGHSRVRRRPLGGHRRHQGALRLPGHPHHGEPRRDVPRPHDRARRGRIAPEDAERDRADDPALGAHDHLPARGGDAAAVRDLQRRRRDASRC